MSLPIADTGRVLDIATLEIQSPPTGITLPGWERFNQFTGGLRPKEFSIFCGPTGAGKSLWLANLTAKLIEADQKVFVAPIEIGEVDFMKMVLSVMSGDDFISGEPADEKTQNKLVYIVKTRREMIEKNLVLTNYSSRVDIEEFVTLMKFVNSTHKANVVITDNLNFMLKPSRSGDQTLEMDETVHKFVQCVKVIPMHIILVMHPRKTDGGKILSEFDIKGSSTAVQEATNILLMNRLTEEDYNNTNLMEYDRQFVFKKLRKRGKYVNQFFYMRNEDGKGRYTEIERVHKKVSTGDGETLASKWGNTLSKNRSGKRSP